jgi:hypothetical protein
MAGKRHFKQSFTVTSSAQADPIDALRTLLLAGTAAPYSAPGSLGVDLTANEGVSIAASVTANETIEAGSLVAFIYAPVDVNTDSSVIVTQRWAQLSIAPKELPVAMRDGVIVFAKSELPQSGRLVVLPQGVTTSAGATSLQLTYSAHRSSL